MNAGHTVRSDTKHPASSHVSTRLWNLPAYGKPLRSAPFHRPWKTPPIHRPRFPQLPQPPPLEEKKPEPDESGSSSSTHDSHIAWYQNRGHVNGNVLSYRTSTSRRTVHAERAERRRKTKTNSASPGTPREPF